MRRIDPYTKRAMTYEEFMARPPDRNPEEDRDARRQREEGRNARQRWEGRNARQREGREWEEVHQYKKIISKSIQHICLCVC